MYSILSSWAHSYAHIIATLNQNVGSFTSNEDFCNPSKMWSSFLQHSKEKTHMSHSPFTSVKILENGLTIDVKNQTKKLSYSSLKNLERGKWY
jgi:hypothetical protein